MKAHWWDQLDRPRVFENLVEGLDNYNAASAKNSHFDRIVDAFRAIEALANAYHYASFGLSRGEARNLENEALAHAGRRTRPGRRTELAEVLRFFAECALSSVEMKKLMSSRDVRLLADLQPFIYDEETVTRQQRFSMYPWLI